MPLVQSMAWRDVGGTVYLASAATLSNWEPIGTTTSSTTMTFTTTTTTTWPEQLWLGDGMRIAPYTPSWPELSAEELAARDARRVQRAAERDEQRRSRARVQDRAVELLRALLTPAQLAQYELDGAFEVVGSDGGRYRIRRGVSGNVRLLDPGGEEAAGLCAHPELRVHDDDQQFVGHLPEADVAVGQMLLLQTDEAEFLRRANVHWGSTAGAHRRLVAA